MISINLQKNLGSKKSSISLDVNISINKGEFVTLFGESGAGKTSVLRMISGLLKPDNGLIDVDGQNWFNSKKRISKKPQSRSVGFVFQDYALFPNMSVLENLRYALQNKNEDEHIEQIIQIFELEDLVDRQPESLSGGQKQRVALARTMVQKPNILLLDEPLSALDRQMRIKLQDYLLEVHRIFALTTVLVSHDVSEIMKLSDRVICLKEGKIVKEGTPEEIFVNHQISGKFRFTGEVLNIEKEDVIFIVTVLIQNNVIKVIADSSEIEELQIGDKVMVASKAFNPILYKIDS